MFGSPARLFDRIAVLGCLGLVFAGLPQRGFAQCQVLSAPSKFDPQASGLPSYFRFQPRQDALSVGGSPGAQRLSIRYNYGFLVYSIANPGAPARISVEDLMGTDKYPKSGDGQSRTGPIVLSPDGTRALAAWTDATGYGTIVLNANGASYYPVGDFPPGGDGVRTLAALKIGTRDLGFATTDVGIYASDFTDFQNEVGPTQKNGIPSALIPNAGISSPSGITALEAAGGSYVVSWNDSALAVVNVSNPGPPGRASRRASRAGPTRRRSSASRPPASSPPSPLPGIPRAGTSTSLRKLRRR